MLPPYLMMDDPREYKYDPRRLQVMDGKVGFTTLNNGGENGNLW